MSIRSILNNEKKLSNIAKVVFNSVDKDGSGLIDCKELTIVLEAIYKDLGLAVPSKKYMKEVFNMLDDNGSGTININEFKLLIRCILEYLAE